MQEAASSILINRSREMNGVSRMIGLSLALHGVLTTALFLAPRDWFMARVEPEARRISVSLGGAQGQDVGGMTSIANRTVQQEAQKAMNSPPVSKAPMALPDPTVKPVPLTKTAKPLDKPSAKPPAAGPELKKGPSKVETRGVDVPFGGLASSSGGSGGARVEGDFCCPEYLQLLERQIRSNWNQRQGAAGMAEVKFIIRRDGMITNVELSRATGNPLLDLESRRAVLVTAKLPPLPDRYTHSSLTVYVQFEYKRQ
jgi:TonB family protein